MKTNSLTLFLVTLTSLALTAAEPAKVAQIKSGELREARVSWWGFDDKDSTSFLQDAFNSSAETVIVDKMPTPWIAKPVTIKGPKKIVFESGAEILAMKNEFKGRNDVLVTIENQADVSIIGEGSGGILRMHKADYQSKEYSQGEWRHCLMILSSDNISVKNMLCAESGGDGIYIGVSNSTPRKISKNVTISKVVCDKNHRQGISVIAAIDLLIEDTVMSNTSGTAPMAGIDFEPNKPHETLSNCVVRNCITENNASSGYTSYLPQLDTRLSGKVSLRFENCISRNDGGFGFSITTCESKPRDRSFEGTVDVVNCRFEKSYACNINVRTKTQDKLNINFKDCVTVSGMNRKNIIPVPVHIWYVSSDGKPCQNNVVFDNLLVKGKTDGKWFDVNDQAFCGTKNYKVKGVATIDSGDSKTTVNINEDWLKKEFADRDFSTIPSYSTEGKTFVPAGSTNGIGMANMKCRNKGDFWVYAKQGEKIVVRLNHPKLTSFRGDTEKVFITTPSGKKSEFGKIEFQEEKDFVLESAPETGIYIISLSVGKNWTSLVRCNLPAGVYIKDSLGINVIYTTGEYYFSVPQGTPKAAVRLHGEGGTEGAKVTFHKPDGSMLWSRDNISTAIECFLGENTMPGIWKMTIEKPSKMSLEDFQIQLLGLPPFLTSDPNAVLVIK